MNKIKVLSLLQVIGHPRDSKRIDMLTEAGFEVEIAAFERDYHTGRIPRGEITKLGYLDNGRYFIRMIKIVKSLSIIRRLIKKCDIIYATGPDLGVAGFLAGIGLGKPIVLEVGDIVNIQLKSGVFGFIIRFIDRLIVKNYKLIVVISPGFRDVYFKSWLKYRNPILLIENKLDDSILKYKSNLIKDFGEKEGIPLKDRPLKIGYFGLLRDEWSWFVLKELVIQYPEKFQLFLAGKPFMNYDIIGDSKTIRGISYFGEYKSPDDLGHIYNKVDMVWACYPAIGKNDWNLRWGRPNRYFESCYFRKPLFARQGAHFSHDVTKYEIGLVIHQTDIKQTVNEINTINSDDFIHWTSNLKKLPEEVYLYKTETEELKRAIMKLSINKS